MATVISGLWAFHLVASLLRADSFLLPRTGTLPTILNVEQSRPKIAARRRRGTKTTLGPLWYTERDDAEEAAEVLPLSPADLDRLKDLRSRHETMPIMILDAVLPGQQLEFGSGDPKFLKLLEHVLDEGSREIGMIGLNPHTGRPLNIGVTLPVTKGAVHSHQGSDVVTLTARGDRRFEVQGEPWLDESGSFYLADVEIVEGREEPMSAEQMEQARGLSERVPGLMDTWKQWVVQTGKSDMEGMEKRMKDIGPMPQHIGKRAIWAASLINPLPPLGVCVEVRPAMLACRNDLERVTLAIIAIQASIDHLSGKRRLF